MCVFLLGRMQRVQQGLGDEVLTSTRGHSAIPLGQGIGHGLAPDGIGAVERVAWTAFKEHHHTDAKVIPYPLPKPGLRDWATLSGTSPRYSYG